MIEITKLQQSEISIKKIVKKEYLEEEEKWHKEQKIQTIMNKYKELTLTYDDAKFFIEYTPATKDPNQICDLIRNYPAIFEKLRNLRILPHKIASADYGKIKKGEGYNCNKSYNPEKSLRTTFKNFLTKPVGGKKSRKEKHKKKKNTKKRKTQKKEKHKETQNI